jgi:hypothetical protein
MSSIKYIYFHNDSRFALNISSWVDGSNTLSCSRIGPGEKKLVHSSVGEWHLDSMVDAEADRLTWTSAGLAKHLIIGKFRSGPCASGNYSWMEYDEPFECTYSENDHDNDVKGLVRFYETKLST